MSVTLLHRLNEWAIEAPDSAAQSVKRGGEWKSISAKDFNDRVYYLALYLESRGFGPQDLSAILAFNSPEWVTQELAIVLLGGKSAGLYPNSTQKDIHYILNHTEARVLGVQDKTYFKKIVGSDGSTSLPERIELVIVYDNDTSISPKAVAYETAIAEGKKIADSGKAKSHEDYLAKLDPKAAAYLIYTSGTTGNPKGAMLSNDNFCYTSDVVVKHWNLPKNGSIFSFLPLCHVAEKIQNIGVGITQRYTANFCTKFEAVSIELPEVKPTLLLCVPRLWEKMMESVNNKIARAPAKKKKLAQWALAVGKRVSEAKYAGKFPALADIPQYILADKLVLSKIREAAGLSNVYAAASGAAALAPHITKWFRSIGIEINEDFGQTESTGCICMTVPGKDCAGTVGVPLPSTEFKIAEDGEIICRGRHVFVGYFKDAESTKNTVDEQGWLHTGDLGVVNEQGMVQVRGRKKEILKTSGGKMVAPLPIEEEIKEADMISQVCIVGDGRKYLSALITLAEVPLSEVKVKPNSVTGEVVTDTLVITEVKRKIDDVNKRLASYEQIKKFTVLGREFSIEDGEMTPTLKMKRNVIEKRFQNVIDRMYQ